jgi:ABC-type phosphate transport system substrate-binding protein
MTNKRAAMKRYALFVFLLLPAFFTARAQKTVIIANRSSHAQQMTQDEVRDIFTGSVTRFKNGTEAVPVVLRSGQEQDFFLREFIGKLDSSFRNGWRSLVFSGQGTMLKIVDDDAAMLAYVANTPGAIGYVSKAAVRDNVITVTVR